MNAEEKEKRCWFWNGGGYCRILSETMCDGKNSRCTFRKTAKQFVEDSDNAIKLNRERGNCEKCQYRQFPCQLSTEL